MSEAQFDIETWLQIRQGTLMCARSWSVRANEKNQTER